MQTRTTDILACGLLVCDILASPLDISVFRADTAHLDSICYASGGDALNVATACSKLGMRVGICGCIGNDMSGDFLLKTARNDGIDPSNMERTDSAGTSTSIILREPNGERHFAFYPGANIRFDGTKITDQMLRDASLLYIGSTMALPGLDGAPLAELFRRAKAAGTMTSMDATSSKDGLWLEKIADALPYTDIFIPSLGEASSICGTDDPDEILSFLHGRGVRIAGVKLGKAGVQVESFRIPAFECDPVVDTTGAGDCFMAGFCTGILKGFSIRDAAVFGSAVSNFCIRSVGATTGIRSFEETMKLAETYSDNKRG